MPTYVYETTDSKKPTRTFELRQSIKDSPLQKDPETGRPVRRVISTGAGILTGISSPAPRSSGGCGAGCGCHH